MESRFDNALIIEGLSCFGELNDKMRHDLNSLPLQTVSYRGRQDIYTVGDYQPAPFVLLSGLLISYLLNSDGSRRITNIMVPGDLSFINTLTVTPLDYRIASVGPSRIGNLSLDRFDEQARTHPHLVTLVLRSEAAKNAMLRRLLIKNEAIVSLAHLICELFYRLKGVKLADNTSIYLPLTQQDFADALGITAIHVNRMFRALRELGLIKTQARLITIQDETGLQKLARFDPTYLNCAK